MHRLGIALLCGLALLTSNLSAAEYTLKFATLAPPGSTWMNLLEDWGRTVKVRSQGRLEFKFYPGGVQGDEPDVIKKMRFGQLHGGAFTGYGIGQMYSPARVLELPFLFENTAEVDAVRAAFTPEFERGFRDHGYRLLGWMEVGAVYFFSQYPIETFDELQQRRIWLWQGDALGEALFRAGKLAPVPLSITDVFTSLSTGLIDTVYSTPLAAIALQWFTKTPYRTDVPMANGMGALVVSNRFFDTLPADLQALLEETGRATGRQLIETARADNLRSLEVLKEEGVQVVMPPGSVNWQELTDLRDRAATELTADGYIPRALYERTWEQLQQLRAGRAAGYDAGHDAGHDVGQAPGAAPHAH
ncbi:MAG: TRAP transporter substrate-binding protein DctP [Gammaproteobacteria bacterium]|nr:TRAP transporter substrate-binding protein DctP [Gammaproteobacteria bacterium]